MDPLAVEASHIFKILLGLSNNLETERQIYIECMINLHYISWKTSLCTIHENSVCTNVINEHGLQILHRGGCTRIVLSVMKGREWGNLLRTVYTVMTRCIEIHKLELSVMLSLKLCHHLCKRRGPEASGECVSHLGHDPSINCTMCTNIC